MWQVNYALYFSYQLCDKTIMHYIFPTWLCDKTITNYICPLLLYDKTIKRQWNPAKRDGLVQSGYRYRLIESLRQWLSVSSRAFVNDFPSPRERLSMTFRLIKSFCQCKTSIYHVDLNVKFNLCFFMFFSCEKYLTLLVMVLVQGHTSVDLYIYYYINNI
jgi:hypothetical protein